MDGTTESNLRDAPARVGAVLEVPQRFSEHVHAVDLDGSALGVARLDIAVVARREHVVSATFEEPMSPTALLRVDWVRAAHDALLIRAMKEATTTMAATGLDERARATVMDDLIRAVPPGRPSVRTYNRLRFEDYEAVAEAWRSGGPQEVRRRFHVSVRQANRYVAKAKEWGLL